MSDTTADEFRRICERARQHREEFWAEVAAALTWVKPWDKVLDDTRPPFYRWFAGGMLNTCYNAVDRHVDSGRADQTALIYDSPVTGSAERITFAQLRDRTARLGGALRQLGVGRGDRIIIYMPMIPEAVIAMLACARIGAIHSVVFGGFAPNELATRIDDAKPTLILTASCGVEPGRLVRYKPLLDAAIAQARHKPSRVLVYQRPQAPAELIAARDLDWNDTLAAAEAVACVPVLATDPLYILYTSGTTGQPKGVVRDNGGHAVALQWTMKHLYGVAPGETYWAASDVGWVVGHSYIVYGPLLNGNTTVLYEGKPVGTPDAGAFWRVIEQYRVCTLFTAPTAIRAIKREDPSGELVKSRDLSWLRALFLAGERSDPATIQWAEAQLHVPVIDHWWQTETGWAIAGNPLGIGRVPIKYGSTARAMPGWDVHVLDADGRETPRTGMGALCLKLPLPPGAAPTLWNADARYESAYLSSYPGFYQTGDAGLMDEDDYIYVMSRTDDIINVAGHRLSTGAMEEVLAAHPDVAECAVIGIADALKGQVPLGLLVLKKGAARAHDEIVKDVVQAVRDRIGPVAGFKRALVIQRLPKTRSGKILRGTLQKIADGETYSVPATIDDPAILDEIATVMRELSPAS